MNSINATWSPCIDNINSIVSTPWDSASSIEIAGGYGSCYDTEIYHGVICDDCLSQKMDRLYKVSSVRSSTAYKYE